MATIQTHRASYQHHNFTNTGKEHPLSHSQRMQLKTIKELIDRMENNTRNEAALALRMRSFRAEVSDFLKSFR